MQRCQSAVGQRVKAVRPRFAAGGIEEVRVLHRHRTEVAHRALPRIIPDQVMQRAAADAGRVVDLDHGVNPTVRSDTERAAGIRIVADDPRPQRLGFHRPAGRPVEVDCEQACVVQQLQVRRPAVLRQPPVRMYRTVPHDFEKRGAVDQQLVDGCFLSLRIVPRDLVVRRDRGGSTSFVDQRIRLIAQDRAEHAIALFRLLHVVDHPVLVLAGDDIDQPTRLVGDDIDHAFAFCRTVRQPGIAPRHRHAKVPGGLGLRIVGQHVTAPVCRDVARLLFRRCRIALLGADIDRAGGPDEIAGVDLGLGGVAGRCQGQSHDLMGVDHNPHFLRVRIEFDQVRIASVRCCTDVDPPVLAFAQAEVAGLVGGRLGRDMVGLAPGVPAFDARHHRDFDGYRAAGRED